MKNTSDIVRRYTPLTMMERVQLIAREAYLSATDPHNGEHYSTLTDLTSIPALTKAQYKMRQSSEGRRILQEKPRITNSVIETLEKLPENTFGKAYFSFLTRNQFLPEERAVVNHVPDLELAYICQRYKEVHDMLHILVNQQTTVKGQLLLKWFEMIQMKLPSGSGIYNSATMAALASPLLANDITLCELAAVCRLAEKHHFILNVYYEKHFEEDLGQFKQSLLK